MKIQEIIKRLKELQKDHAEYENGLTHEFKSAESLGYLKASIEHLIMRLEVEKEVSK